MRAEPPKPTAAQIAKAAALRQTAIDRKRREEESFQRCDTDGFLSQWALSIGAQRDEANAKILDNGGYARFPVLCDADGNVIADREFRFENPHPVGFGVLVSYSWKLTGKYVDQCGRRWIPSGPRSRIQKKLGLHEETRWFPAVAEIHAPGTGMAGAASASVRVVRMDTGKGSIAA